jgi:flavin-dependent dehydrogenase
MKIVIVGGGTSGWMTAAAVCKTFPEWDVTIVASGDSIGVGESTTPHINEYLKYMNISDDVFLPAARATFKSSSRFEDFVAPGKVFHYPNGQSVSNEVEYHDWMQAKAFYPDKTPPFAEVLMPFVAVAEMGKMPLNDQLLFPYDLAKDRSFHINAKAFSEYLRDTFCKNIKVVDSKVKSVRIKKRNITSVLVDRGTHDIKPHEVCGDIYIDCTGQQRVLSGSLSKWNSFDTILTDSALVVKSEYTNRNEQMVPYTNAKGRTSGWEWTIPTYDFISRGYVFASRFQSEEDARKEFGYNDAHLIKFENGRHERAWTGNCISIGLSYGFIEPLESTSLFNTHHGILALMDILQEGNSPGQFARDRFNHDLAEHMDGWREFVEAHYYYSERRDTPFWRAVTDEVEYQQEGSHEAIRHMMITGDPIPTGDMPIAFILAGSGFTNVNKRTYEYLGYPITINQNTVDDWFCDWEARREFALTLPTMSEFLSGTFDYEKG